jgi:hypothetical protein
LSHVKALLADAKESELKRYLTEAAQAKKRLSPERPKATHRVPRKPR